MVKVTTLGVSKSSVRRALRSMREGGVDLSALRAAHAYKGELLLDWKHVGGLRFWREVSKAWTKPKTKHRRQQTVEHAVNDRIVFCADSTRVRFENKHSDFRFSRALEWV